ncbi:HDOD domain-containing protein [Thermodesulfobacteriota bacterium]
MLMDEMVRSLMKDKDIQLPTLPVIASNIMKLANDPDTSAQDLAAFIEQDPAITNKLLMLANSAFYGQAKAVETVQRAVMVIGFNEVTRLALSVSVMSSFDLKGVEKILNMRNLWMHSICCATAAETMARIVGLKESEHIFVIGLLHDMGKIVLAIAMPEEYATILNSASERKVPLCLVEAESMGVNHADLAGHFMKEWNFPDSLRLPVKFHHAPMKCPGDFQRQAMVVSVANFFCHKVGMGLSGSPSYDDVKMVVANLGLKREDLKEVADVLSANKQKIEEYLSFMG